MAITLAGMTGFLAERVRDNAPGTVPSACWDYLRDEWLRR